MPIAALLLAAAWSAPVPASCAPGAGLLVDAPPVVLRCPDGVERCAAELRVTVRNCGPSPVALTSLHLDEGGGASVRLEFSPPVELSPGAGRSVSWELSSEGGLVPTVGLSDGRKLRGRRVAVTNPALEALRARCSACRGVLGRFGLMGTLACDCPARDQGKRCFDGSQCEGACLLAGYEVVDRGLPLTCDGGTCRARAATGRPVGRCSARTQVFGCKPYLDGAHPDDPPVPLPAHTPLVCRD